MEPKHSLPALPFTHMLPHPSSSIYFFFFFFLVVVVSEMSRETKRENEIGKMVYEERAAKAGFLVL